MSQYNPYRNNNNYFNSAKGQLADFTHASELYIKNNYRLAPNTKFLYHTVFNINQSALSKVGSSLKSYLNGTEINMLCKSAELPSFNMQTDTKNQYNRKKVVQTRLNYSPVRFRFHDDRAGVTTALWEAYYRYYYKDGTYSKINSLSQPDNVTNKSFPTTDLYSSGEMYRYGFDNSHKTNKPFFNSITTNVLSGDNGRSVYTSYTLVNPIISEWSHDETDQESSQFLESTMAIEYEAVHYGRGNTSSDNPAGFADPSHYDVTPSPLYNSAQDNLYPYLTPWGEVFEDVANGTVGYDTILQTLIALQSSGLFGGSTTSTNSAPNGLGFSVPRTPVSSIDTQSNNNLDQTQNTNQSDRDLLESLNQNRAAAESYAFATEYVGSQNSGSFNDRKNEWNNLPLNVKTAFIEQAKNKLR